MDYANLSNDQLSQLLFEAARDGNADTVGELIEAIQLQDGDITPTNNDGLTPLHLAAREGHTETARVLIEAIQRQGGDVNPADTGGVTTLHVAARRDNTETARVLVEAIQRQGGDINPSSPNCLTPLHLVARKGHTNTARVLIEAIRQQGADINQADEDGETPLYVAAESARNEIVILLLQYGATDADGAATSKTHRRGYFLTARILELWNTLQRQYIRDNLYFTTEEGVSNREVLSTILTSECLDYQTFKKIALRQCPDRILPELPANVPRTAAYEAKIQQLRDDSFNAAMLFQLKSNEMRQPSLGDPSIYTLVAKFM